MEIDYASMVIPNSVALAVYAIAAVVAVVAAFGLMGTRPTNKN